MALRNTTFEIEQIEQLALITRLPSHHDPPPMPSASESPESLFTDPRKPFSTASDPNQTPALQQAPSYSITSSAKACSLSGMSRPSALAVFMLTTKWYLIGC